MWTVLALTLAAAVVAPVEDARPRGHRVLSPPAEFLALEPAPAGAPPLLYCTPEGYGVVGQDFQAAEHAIVEALGRAEAGSTVLLEDGEYPPFTLGLGSNAWNNADVAGGEWKNPVVIDGRGRARIVGRDTDAIGIDQRRPVAHITFRGVRIETGQRSGVMFYKRTDGRDHRGFTFENCEILGGFDHRRGTGRRSKWGVWGHRLRNFRFVGTLEPARVAGIRDEHAFYLQNPQGDVTIENVVGNGLGRTFVQLTNRLRDGPPGQGKFVVRNCQVANVGLAPGDKYRGGTAFTVAGRFQGELLFEGNTFRGGFDPEFARLRPVGEVHGTGAFVAWQGGQEQPNATLVLRDNDFRMAFGCGDRALVALSGCETVRLEGANHFESGGFQPALALEPRDDQGRPTGDALGSLVIDPATELEGGVTYRGEPLPPEQLARYHPPADDDGR